MSSNRATQGVVGDTAMKKTDRAQATAEPVFSGFSRAATTIALPYKPSQGIIWFKYHEYGYIGDAVNLRLSSGVQVPAGNYPLTMHNGLRLTYGQISALAGEFYGTKYPISDGPTPEDKQKRFLDAFSWLANDTTRQPKECTDILALLQPELDAINLAVQLQKDPSMLYNGILPDITDRLQSATSGRPTEIPDYLGLASINWDRFGIHARHTYNAGHTVALLVAAKGDLEKAYTLNAFADRYLHDSFSAGHLRTPRSMLHSADGAKDMCAKFMHDEDNAIGLTVKNPAGDAWTVYGGTRTLDAVNSENTGRCLEALQTSADEIWAAWRYKDATPVFKAWDFAPTLESANGPQVLAPLFKDGGLCRSNFHDRRTESYTTSWSPDAVARELWVDSWWSYPISIDGPQHILPWTGITACTSGVNYLQTMVLYQNPDDGIRMSQVIQIPSTKEYAWSGGPTSRTLADGLWFTPMASVAWQRKDYEEYTLEGYAFYVDEDHYLSDAHYIAGKWSPGNLKNSLGIGMDWFGSMAATTWFDGSHAIRLYLQEAGKTQIQEVRWDSASKRWSRGATLYDAAKGTSLAAIAFPVPGEQENAVDSVHVYYQTSDSIIRCATWARVEGWQQNTSIQWTDAAPFTGLAAVITPVGFSKAANVFYTGNDSERSFCQRVWTNETGKNWTLYKQPQPVKRMNTSLAAVPSDAGFPLRLYCQDSRGQIVEIQQGMYDRKLTTTVVAKPF